MQVHSVIASCGEDGGGLNSHPPTKYFLARSWSGPTRAFPEDVFCLVCNTEGKGYVL
jgi:hypothetical protein